MIVGAAAHGTISFAQYLLLLLPVGAACLAVNALVLLWLFRKELPGGPLVERHPPKPAIDTVLAVKGIGALALFAALAVAGVSLAGASMTAAATLMVVARTPPKKALAVIDWQLLVFFAGLFVVVAGIAATGLLTRVFEFFAPAIARGDLVGDLAFLTIVVIASNAVSNVPLVLIAVAWVPQMPDPVWGYIMLAVGSTLAGNLTLLGSVANLIVMEGAGPRGEIGFWRFLRYGVPITVVNLALAFAILSAQRGAGVFRLLGL
jgi:Na+/H+ antiporter NhaD/arsenite permease-like protein